MPRLLRILDQSDKISTVASPNTVITPNPSITPTQPVTEDVCSNSAKLINQTIPSGKVFPSATNFEITWIVKNVGTCVWTTDYSLQYFSGTQMEAISIINLPYNVEPDKSVEITLEMISPVISGSYQGNWILSDPWDDLFGWGEGANLPFEVSINVDDQAVAIPDPGLTNTSHEIDMPAMGGGGGDIDNDGLSDGFEEWMANTFFPIMKFNEDESVSLNQVMRFYQVTPIYKTSPGIWNFPNYIFPEYQGPQGVLITYVMAYPFDYGDAILGINAHKGDTEVIRMLIVNPRDDPNVWGVATIAISRHYDNPERYYPIDFAWEGTTHPVVWVSQDKHAMYSSYNECDDYSFGYEYCGERYEINYPIKSGVDGFNVGERDVHPFSKIPNNSLGLFTDEYAWSSNESNVPEYDNSGKVIGTFDYADNFCGGQGFTGQTNPIPFIEGHMCSGGLDSKWWPLPDPNSQSEFAYRLAVYASSAYTHWYGAEYEICFYTGNMDHAGTDLHVNVTLEGTAHNQVFYDLDDSFNNFEKNGIDCFYAGTYNLNEKLTSLSLFVYNDPANDSEWFLKGLSVREQFKEELTYFSCNCWIDNSERNDPDIGQNTIGPYIYLSPDL